MASLIPYETLKLITDTLSENSVSVYNYFLTMYFKNSCQPFQFTITQVKEFIGISTKTRSNDDIITNILFILQKIGLLGYSMTAVSQDVSNFQDIKTIYQIDWVTNRIID